MCGHPSTCVPKLENLSGSTETVDISEKTTQEREGESERMPAPSQQMEDHSQVNFDEIEEVITQNVLVCFKLTMLIGVCLDTVIL